MCPLWGVETGGLRGVLTASLALGSVSDCLKGIQHSDRAGHLMSSSGTCRHNPSTNTVCHTLPDPTPRPHILPDPTYRSHTDPTHSQIPHRPHTLPDPTHRPHTLPHKSNWGKLTSTSIQTKTEKPTWTKSQDWHHTAYFWSYALFSQLSDCKTLKERVPTLGYSLTCWALHSG